MGPDADTLISPEKTTSLGKPVGKNSSEKTWEGDQWKIGGGATWGWISYDPALNLVYYGSGNPSTWNPMQRPGDNKWSMTIWARDADTGMAKWVYQMTPHDQWDYDGINEMVLSEQKIGGKERKLLTHFDRNGFGYTLDRVTGELLVAEKYRSQGQLGDQGRHGQVFAELWPAEGRREICAGLQRGGRELHRRLPGGSRLQGRAAGVLFACHRNVLRADESRLHGL